MTRIIGTNYNGECSWIPEESGNDYFIYDRTNCGLDHRVVRKNLGDADYDKLTYIVDFYSSLPDVFILTKTNLFKYITKEEFDEVKRNTDFTPLLTKNHRTYDDMRGPVCYYDKGIYWERNDSWYLNHVPAKHVKSWNEWADLFGLPKPNYLPFAPGGNYIVTRERVHRHPKELYAKMRDLLPYTQRPGEAHCAERSYGILWGDYL